MTKIFCIGFNKSGTTSLHDLFQELGYSSIHDSFWWYYKDIHQFKHDAYTDGYERYYNEPTFPDLEFLETTFKDSKFILNTRKLNKWLLSRLRHNHPDYLIGLENKVFNDDVLLRWVKDRNFWYEKVYDYFKHKDNLLIVDIDRDDVGEKITTFLNVDSRKLPHTHITQRTFGVDVVDNFLNTYISKNDWETSGICKLL